MLIDAHSKVLKIIGFRPTGDFGPLTGYTSKRGKAVWYLKAPPKTPPTGHQLHQRNLIRMVARLWTSLTPAQRADWLAAAQLAALRITGYNLFVYYHLTLDTRTVATVERISGVNLTS